MPNENTNKDAASAYTADPYPEFVFPETHPARIAAQGFLHGLKVPDPTTARVFEFGSAAGSNLISLATSLPDATFHGIDITPQQVKKAQAAIKTHRLTNITLDRADILEMDLSDQEGDAEYDYIIAHGMLSWVPDDVKDRMLELIGKHLAPNGIAYVSYNTLPGWSVNEAVADIMQLAVDQEGEGNAPLDRAKAAHGLMQRLFENAQGPHVDLVKFELDHISKKHQTLVLHDELEGTNDPCYFLQFVEWASEHGLKHFTDATLPTFWPTALLKEQRDILASRGLSWLHMQQYLDFVEWRRFRRSILCRADAAVSELPDLNQLDGIAVKSQLRGYRQYRGCAGSGSKIPPYQAGNRSTGCGDHRPADPEFPQGTQRNTGRVPVFHRDTRQGRRQRQPKPSRRCRHRTPQTVDHGSHRAELAGYRIGASQLKAKDP